MLPSRSALSDLSLIADLFRKNAPKLVLFLPEKSVFWPKKFKKSDFQCFSLPQKSKKYLKDSLNLEYKKKFICHLLELGFGNKSDFLPQNSEFRSAFDLIFGRNMV